jgi:hypothetical protein
MADHPDAIGAVTSMTSAFYEDVAPNSIRRLLVGQFGYDRPDLIGTPFAAIKVEAAGYP